MSRNKQVVLNLMVIVALFVSLVGVLPVGAGVAADVPEQAAAETSPAQVSDKSATKPDRQPGQLEAVTDVKNLSNEPAIYMIRLADPPLAAYAGGVTGLKATSPQATGERKLNVKSAAAQAYMAYLSDKHTQAITAAEQTLKRPLVVVYQYYTANNGFATYLTPAEAEVVAKQPGVIYTERDAESQLQTDVGPSWIGANTIWDGSATGTATKGEGVIVGVIDTGINHASPSFADIGGDGYNHTNPWGPGVYVGYCVANPSFCNDKLIGAWGFPTVNGGNPEDADGHGSHTASTSAGNVVTATLTSTSGAVFTRTISGVAPHANVVMYAACCTNSALAAAIDQIITDTVDVVNYSIGSTSGSDPWTQFDSVGFLNARNAGIFVANSAGNAGPGFATLGSPSGAPWLTAVAASTHNRQFLSSVISATGGLITNTPPVLNGRGMSNGLGLTSIVYAGAAPYNDPLCQISTPDGTFTGKIVVCNRGTNGRVEKGQNVAARGAVGMIMVEVGPDGPGYFTTDSEQPIPAVYLTSGDGNLLKAWLATGTGHQVALSPTVMDVNASYGDIMASFSSRGENTSVADLIAPSVTAPGVAIFAAYKTPEEFAVIQGTSMSSPHVAGAAALMVAAHPNWTPAEIQSALMSSSNTNVVKEDGVTPADPFDMGAGRVDLYGAGRAGIVLNETNARYVAANPGIGGDPKTLNLASFGNAQCLSTCSWTRTLSSTMNSAVTWTSSVTSAAGITLTVTPASFTLPAHGSRVITVTANVSALPSGVWAFGSVMLTPDVATTVAAHFPVAVKPTSGVLPNLVTVNTRRNAGSQTVTGLQSIAATNLTMNSFGLAQATLTHRLLPQDATPNSVYDNLNDPGLFFITMTVPAGAKRLVAEVTDSTSLDLDLYVHLDANNDGLPQQTEQACVSASGAVLEYCSMTNPAPGTYIVLVQNWDASAAITDTVTLATAVVTGSDAGNMTVTGPASVGQLVPYNLNLAWNTPAMVAGDRWYGAFALGTTPATPGNIGTIPVNIVRMADDVSKTVNTATANRGDTITYTITVLPNVTPVDLAYVLTDTIPAGLTYVPGSVTATAGSAAVTGNQLTWSGTLGAQSRRYAMTTSNTDASCVMPLANSGAYVNLQPLGVLPNPTISGDTLWYSTFTTGAKFNYWGTDYTGINFTDDGMAFFGSTPGSTPWINQDIPNAADPNNLMAMMWRDWEVVYATAPISRGVSLATIGGTTATGRALIEYDDVQLFGNPSQTMDFEVLARRTPNDTPGTPEVIFAYDNISMTHPIGVGTIGVENADGTDGTKYAYNNAALDTLTNGMAICFDWYLPSASPVTITYRATVNQNVASGTVLTNQVLHNTNNPGSQVAMAKADVTVPAAYGVALAPATAAQAGNPGQTITYTLRLTNTGDLADTFALTYAGNLWTVQLPVTQTTLSAGQATDVVVHVTIPANAQGGNNDDFVLTATSQGDVSKTASSTLTTTANAVFGVALTPATAVQDGNPGEVLTYTLHLTNTGNFTDTFNLAYAGNLWTVQLPVTQTTLAASAGTNVSVRVTIPANAQGGANDDFTVTATSQGDGSKSASSTVTTTVLSPDLWVQKTGPATAKVGDIVTYTITYGNNGTGTAANAWITDTVLAGTTPITQFVIPLGTVPAAPFSMTLVYTLPVLPVYAGITFTNQVKINTTDVDANLANDAAQAQTYVGVPPVAAFAPSATTAKINTSVSFINASVGTPPLTYLWNFGDGSVVTTTVNTTHVYTHSGVFTVTLMASSPWGPDNTYAVAITITPYGNYLPIVIRN